METASQKKLHKKLLFSVLGFISSLLLIWGSFKIDPKINPLLSTTTDATNSVDQNQNKQNTKPEGSILVNKVIDGDTIEVYINNTKEHVRIIGINTPEIANAVKKTPAQCWGNEAAVRTTKALTGQYVFLEADPSQTDRDIYKRLLRFVKLTDGSDWGLILIKEGFAREYTYKKPYKYQQEYKQSQFVAREQQLGLWNPKKCPQTKTN